VSADDLHQVIGRRAKIEVEVVPEKEHLLALRFTRGYTQAITTYLRTRHDCAAVRLRIEYLQRNGKTHCTPQCEGAWMDAERGEEHDQVCECPCGGARHNEGRPWWSRWRVDKHEETKTDRQLTRVRQIRILPPTGGAS
jgi:hypothetical protein